MSIVIDKYDLMHACRRLPGTPIEFVNVGDTVSIFWALGTAKFNIVVTLKEKPGSHGRRAKEGK